MYFPRQQKFKKQQKGKSFNRINGTILGLNNLKFGTLGLKVIEPIRLNSKQLETIYQSINKIIKKNGRVIIKYFPQTPITKKPIEVRMGKGKGNVDFWVAKIKSGSILCEIETSFKTLALKALTQAKIKLPVKTKICFKIF